MKKLAFVGNSEPPAKLLEIFKKFTPGSKGIWGQLEGVDNYKEADYFAVIDYLPSQVRSEVNELKCVFLGAHPPTLPAYKDMSKYKGLKMFDCKDTVGFLEWWLAYDYDYLKALQPPSKTKVLGSIVSNANTQECHQIRLKWLERFTNLKPTEFDLHGRIVPFTDNMQSYYRGACGSYDPRGAAVSGGNDHMSGKEEVYASHKYMLEFDNIGGGGGYFSERILDCLLMWAMPIYWGGENLHKFIPQEAFHYLNINGNGDDVLEIVKGDSYEKALPAIAEARRILLDELQVWARVHQAIFGSFK